MSEKDLYISKSSVETFLECPAKFDYRYIKKVQAERKIEEQQAAIFGNVVHEALELYFGNDKKDDLMELYQAAFAKEKNALDKDKYVLGETMIQDYAIAVDNGNEILCVEKDFMFYLDNGVPIKGFIDRIDKISDEEIEVIDYKTGYTPPLTPKQLEYDIQLGMYNLAALDIYPGFKRVKLTLSYLHFGNVSCYITPDRLDTLKNYLSIVYNRMVEAINSGEDQEARVNSHCSYCDYKNRCDKYKQVIVDNADAEQEDFKGLIAPASGLIVDIDNVDVFLKNIQSKQKLLKSLEFQVKDFIKAHIEENGDSGRAKVGKTYYSMASKKNTSYDLRTVMALCESAGIDISSVLNVKKTDVDKIFKKDKEAMEKLGETATVSFSNPYVK